MISAEDKTPTGVLKDELRTLSIALYQKPVGAASIRAYILEEGEAEWTELSGLSLLEELYQPSTEGTGYGLLLREDQEPYRSYLVATEAGETPVPFFVGLIIEGGIYDDRELILCWPDVYEQLPDLPKIRAGQGNEGNAGADNKEDSTESGQRPALPQAQNDGQKQPDSDANDNPEEQLQPAGPDAVQEEQQTPQTPSFVGSNSGYSGRRLHRRGGWQEIQIITACVCSHAVYILGSSITNFVPFPTVEYTSMVPPSSATMPCTIYSPSPVPISLFFSPT